MSIDASRLRFADSSGVQALLDVQRLVHASGHGFGLRAPSRPVRLVLETLGLVSVLGVVAATEPGRDGREGGEGPTA